MPQQVAGGQRPVFKFGRVEYDESGGPKPPPKKGKGRKDDHYAYWYECTRLRMDVVVRDVAKLAGVGEESFRTGYSRWLKKSNLKPNRRSVTS
jgi:hypothetical protein